MPQQINLCTPILLTQKRYFSAQTMALTLAVFVVLGGGLCATWVWSLHSASAGYTQTMAAQSIEVDGLQAAIQRGKASAAPVDPALVQQLQERRKAVQQRGELLIALQTGLLRPGEGHSDRLKLVARSIPAPVWVTEVKADPTRFELSGFTLEPAALNTWVDTLAGSPLMRGLKLATVKVESAVAAQLKVPGAATSAATTVPVSAQRAVWSFNLVNLEPLPGVGAVSTTGSKP
jgi:Tfp pilus assembly protein PilN